MRLWGQRMNQWKTWQRCSLLFSMLLVLLGVWYFLLEQPLLKKNATIVAKQLQAQEILKESALLLQQKENFVYKNDLQTVVLRQIFQGEISHQPGLEITSFKDAPATVLPAGANQFTQAKAALGIFLLPAVRQSSTTIVLSGGFKVFKAYLKAIQDMDKPIYFESINFSMNRYPQAQITMKVFTLGA